MNPPISSPQLSQEIRDLLAGLRWRIKAYVWVEGLAVAIVWLAMTFWVAYAIDYWLLVRVFALEFPWYLRGILLFGIAGVLGLICYRWIVRRAFVALADESMAVVLERRFNEFQDSLVTSVEMAGHPDHAAEFNREMLSKTTDDALSHVSNVRLRDVFSFAPLFLSSVVALLLVVAVGSFAANANEDFDLAARRIYLLDATPWPRKATIELVGISVEHNENVVGADNAPELLPFDQGKVRVAKGSSVILRVKADDSKVIPDKCVVTYSDDEGNSGTIEMEKSGRPIDGFQSFRLDRQPFRNVINGFHFEVIGKNFGSIGGSGGEGSGISLGLWPVSNRLEGYVEVVDAPIVMETKLDYVRPRYISNSDVHTVIPYARGTTLPSGTKVTVNCLANKPLKFAHIHYPEADETIQLDLAKDGESSTEFTFDLPEQLTKDTKVEITLHDADNIVSESPYRMLLTAVPDEAPKVFAFLSGIGTAVTPDVKLPIAGKVTDDYGVQRVWCDIQATGAGAFLKKVFEDDGQPQSEVAVDCEIDFRDKRNDPDDGFTLVPGDENRLTLVVRSEDHFDLAGQPNSGKGDVYNLDIVTADQLLILLERQEAGQRERMQQVKNEMTEAYDFLLNVRARGEESGSGNEPDDLNDGVEPGDPAEEAQKAHSVRLSYAVKALLQTRKSAQELRGVVATIRDIHDQLENNRVDAEDHKTRLKEDIAEPLAVLCETRIVDEEEVPSRFKLLEDELAELERRLKVLGVKLDDPAAAEDVDESTQKSIEEMQQLLIEMEDILQKLRKIEDYNKLLSYLRELLNDQKELNERTGKRYKQQAIQDLLD